MLFIPETRNIVDSKALDQSYVLKTGNGKRGSLRWSPNSPQRESSVWGYLSRRSSLRLFLEMGLTTSLMSYPASSSSGHNDTQIKGFKFISSFKRHLRCCSRLQIFRVRLPVEKLFIGPVSLKRLRFTPGELSFDQTAVIIGQ